MCQVLILNKRITQGLLLHADPHDSPQRPLFSSVSSFLLSLSRTPSLTHAVKQSRQVWDVCPVLCLTIHTITSRCVSASRGEMRETLAHLLFGLVLLITPLPSIILCFIHLFAPFFYYIYFFLLSLFLTHTLRDMSYVGAPLMNNTAFISLGLFSLAGFKQRGEMGF